VTVLTPSQVQPAQPEPRLVTLAELRSRLLPLCMGWSWAEDAIHDLWLLGAPIPTGPNQPETRILLPGQFKKWYGEIQARMGLATSPEAAYGQIARSFKTSSR
jgi:hypothetical protein